jgi:myo-inositol catabolism protein IolC
MSRIPDSPLYILACDHRRSFERLLGMTGTLTDAEVSRLKDAKRLVWQGFQRALADGIPRRSAGILIDLEYGEEVAREARKLGITFAVPIEKSGQDEFELEHDDWLDMAEDYRPTYVKALVRYNPGGDADMNARQRLRLKAVSDRLRGTSYGFLFELLVPHKPEHLDEVGGDRIRYDRELRPALMLAAIEELQDAGINPDIWKIEGLDSHDDCRATAALVRRQGRRAGCVVLGRGASTEKVEGWLRAARGLPGYLGFAIGRSIFTDALHEFRHRGIAGREDAQAQIANRFSRFVTVYEDKRG